MFLGTQACRVQSESGQRRSMKRRKRREGGQCGVIFGGGGWREEREDISISAFIEVGPRIDQLSTARLLYTPVTHSETFSCCGDTDRFSTPASNLRPSLSMCSWLQNKLMMDSYKKHRNSDIPFLFLHAVSVCAVISVVR